MLKRFNRFELKYVIPAQRLSEIQQDLLRNMQPDANGTAEGNYNISSLYYDTPDLAFMRSKREGIETRGHKVSPQASNSAIRRGSGRSALRRDQTADQSDHTKKACYIAA